MSFVELPAKVRVRGVTAAAHQDQAQRLLQLIIIRGYGAVQTQKE